MSDAMMNEWHPGPRCACGECAARWPHVERPETTRRRPAPDLLPTPPRPLMDRAILEHDRRSTACEHGVAWDHWCERCERGEIARVVDGQLRERR